MSAVRRSHLLLLCALLLSLGAWSTAAWLSRGTAPRSPRVPRPGENGWNPGGLPGTYEALATPSLQDGLPWERIDGPEARDPPPGGVLASDPAPDAPGIPTGRVRRESLHGGVKGQDRVLTPGLRHRYTFALDTRTLRQETGAEVRHQVHHAAWSGTLALTYLGTEGTQHLFHAQVLPLRATVDDGAPGDAGVPEGTRGLPPDAALYVAQDARGRVLSVYFDPRLDAQARRFLRSLLAMTQFVAEDGARWTTEESDALGDFESDYQATGSANTYVKTKRRYLRRASDTAGDALREMPRTQGHLAFTLFGDGLLREVTGSEVVETEPDGGKPRLRTETRVALTFLEQDTGTASLKRFQVARTALRAEGLAPRTPFDRAPPLDKEDARPGRGDDLEALMASLAGPRDAGELARSRARLALLLRQQPAAARRAVRHLPRADASLEMARQVLESLASAGTPEAQRALISLLKEPRLAPGLRIHAASAAALVNAPSPELARALEQVAEEGAGDAELRRSVARALGAVAKGLEPSDPRRSAALVDGLLRRCVQEPSESEACLQSLANAGTASALPYVRAHLKHASPDVRGAAADTLRATPGAEADTLLDTLLLGDPDPRVRARAAKALVQRVAGPHLPAAGMALRHEPAAEVRLEVVRWLGALQGTDASARALLKDAAANDDAEDVRRLATTFLAP